MVWFGRLRPEILLVAALLSACATGIPKEALQITELTLAERQMQTRRFETPDEKMILFAVSGLLQDLGFNLDESETRVGLVVGSKRRDATEADQVALAIFAAVFGVYSPIDEVQVLRASVVTRPVGENSQNIAVQVTFQRIVWDTNNRVSKAESLKDPMQFQEFFEKLSKSLFLEAHEI
jgi:hypothetical protein